MTCRAAAKSGKTVLHIDQAASYGSAWSSLTLDQFLGWAHQVSDFMAMPSAAAQAGAQGSGNSAAADACASEFLHVPVNHAQDQTYSNMQLHQRPVELGPSREFSLDLASKASICCTLSPCRHACRRPTITKCYRVCFAHQTQ